MKNSLTGQFIRTNLQNDGKSFHHKHATHDEQHQFLTNHYRNNAQRRTQCQRADITHKYLGRISVEPQESQTCTYYRRTKYCDLPYAFYIGNAQILCKIDMTCGIGKYHQGTRNQNSRQYCKAIQSISKIDCITGTNNDEIRQNNIHPPQIDCHIFNKWNNQLRLRGRNSTHIKKYSCGQTNN